MSTKDEFLPFYLTGKTVSKPKVKESRNADYDLAQKAAAGDVNAFEQIYWKHHRRVFGVCFQMSKNVTEAEDLTQQVFLQLFRKIGSFRGDSAFSTWLHRMTVNLTLMYFRLMNARKEETTETGELPESGFTGNKRFNESNQITNRLELNEAIDQLPEGYRKVLILHDIQGFEHEEIAKILGCASGTSKSQLHKARRKLRRLLTIGSSFSTQNFECD